MSPRHRESILLLPNACRHPSTPATPALLVGRLPPFDEPHASTPHDPLSSSSDSSASVAPSLRCGFGPAADHPSVSHLAHSGAAGSSPGHMHLLRVSWRVEGTAASATLGPAALQAAAANSSAPTVRLYVDSRINFRSCGAHPSCLRPALRCSPSQRPHSRCARLAAMARARRAAAMRGPPQKTPQLRAACPTAKRCYARSSVVIPAKSEMRSMSSFASRRHSSCQQLASIHKSARTKCQD